MKKLHIVITRLAVNWTNHKNFKQDWDVWVSESIQFMDKFCRPSLQNQSNKDFMLLSLVDDTITEYGNMLPNEVVLKIKADSGNYPKEDILKNIDKYIKSISKEFSLASFKAISFNSSDGSNPIIFEILFLSQKGMFKPEPIPISRTIPFAKGTIFSLCFCIGP